MSILACLRASLLLLVLSSLCFKINAQACSATDQDVLSVGDTSTDSACNYNTIQAAINAATCAVGTTIYVTSELSWTAQHLSITNKNITLIGRGSSGHCGGVVVQCGTLFPCPTAPQATISGSGPASTGVITIRGTSNVTLQYLTISGGNHSGDGGGIDYAGTGTLTLNTSYVLNNTASNGGGITMNGIGSGATLVIGAYTEINGNTANNSAGGIRLQGKSLLTMNQHDNLIFYNHSLSGDGGGLLVEGPATANIGARADGDGPLIYANDALYGGGIAAIAGSGGDATVNISAVDNRYPVRIEDNSASHTGGGIYAKAYVSGTTNFADADVLMAGFRIDGNRAPEGSAVYMDLDSSTVGLTEAGRIFFSGGNCAAGIECNTVSNNENEDVATQQPTTGSTILIQSDGGLLADAFRMQGNIGAHAIRVLGSDSYATVTDCLLTDNDLVAELFLAEDGVTTDIDQCTFAHNTIGAAQVISSGTGGITLTNSIIGQPGINALTHGSNYTIDHIVANVTVGLPDSTNVIEADPMFMDAPNGDYRLLVQKGPAGFSISPAVDFAPQTNTGSLDLDTRPRDQDIDVVTNRFGIRDLGAYEMQPITDRIYADGLGDRILLAY